MGVGVRIFTAAALAAALLSGPAFAQFNKEKEPNPMAEKEEAHRKQNAEIDKQYNAMRKHTENDAQKAAKIDPWQNMRAPSDNAKR